MPLIYQHRIYRQDLISNPMVLYVFGDNVERTGLGGQAGECRGQSNAVGIATKWRPDMHEASFFSDNQYAKQCKLILTDARPAIEHLKRGGIVVWPGDGIGTGLSQLPQRAPKTMHYINKLVEQMGALKKNAR